MVALEGRVGRSNPHGPLSRASVAATSRILWLMGVVDVMAAQPTPFMRKNSYNCAFCTSTFWVNLS